MQAAFERIKAINRQLMYSHTMAIWRLDKVKQPDKSTKVSWVMLQDNIPCKLSKKELDKGGDIKEDVNPIAEAYLIFCAPDMAVKAGDLLEIGGIKYRAGDPFRYPAHQEISAARSDLA